MQSYIFDFKKNTSLMRKGWNKEFDVGDMGASSFHIVLVDGNCKDNFSECVDSDGKLIYSNSQKISQECELVYVATGNTESLVLNEDCTFEFNGEDYPESFKFKGAFLTTDENYVLGYSINQYSLQITTQMKFEKGLVFFDITEGVFDGE